MSPSAEKHLRRFPKARTAKLRELERLDATTARLQREIREQAEADRAVNEYRDSEDWKRGPNALLLIAGKLKVLAARLVQ